MQQTQLCYFVNNFFHRTACLSAQKCFLVAKVPIFGAQGLRKSKIYSNTVLICFEFQNLAERRVQRIRTYKNF